MPDRSLDLAFAALDEHERSALESMTVTLGADLASVPGLAQAVRVVAALRIAADVRAQHPRMDELPALREATVALGFTDPATSAETIARALRRWRASGQNVRRPDDVGSTTRTEEATRKHGHRHRNGPERQRCTEPDLEGRECGPKPVHARSDTGRSRAG